MVEIDYVIYFFAAPNALQLALGEFDLLGLLYAPFGSTTRNRRRI